MPMFRKVFAKVTQKRFLDVNSRSSASPTQRIKSIPEKEIWTSSQQVVYRTFDSSATLSLPILSIVKQNIL